MSLLLINMKQLIWSIAVSVVSCDTYLVGCESPIHKVNHSPTLEILYTFAIYNIVEQCSAPV